MKKGILIGLLGLCLFWAGCITAIDPATGEKIYSFDPNAVNSLEQVAEVVVSITTVLGAVFPWLLPFATAAAGVYGAWRTVKPKFETAKNEATMYHTTTEAIVNAIEQFKITNPKQWEDLSKLLSERLGANIENVIRALRGLPPKD